MPPQRQAKAVAAARIQANTRARVKKGASAEIGRKRDEKLAGQSSASSRKVKSKNVVPAAPLRRAFDDETFGLIQERYQDNLYHLVVQAILWNLTRGKEAKIVLEALLEEYPDATALAQARESDLEAMLHPIGLHRQRAKRLKALGQVWAAQPPSKEQRYKARASGYDAGHGADGTAGWEIAHLPGVGPYALDSYRIFHRDRLRGLATKSWRGEDEKSSSSKDGQPFEPEWKRVVPLDKDLRAFLIWAWRKEGYDWDPMTGKRKPLS